MKIKRVIEIDEKDLERIREIVERENKTALSVTARGTAYITIADSKPYEERPQGDLISREALKKEVTEKVHFTTVDGHIVYHKILKLIDSASPVDISGKENK